LIPIKDLNRSFTTPHVNRLLIMANVIVFLSVILSQAGLIDSRFAFDIERRFAMIPSEILRGEKLYTLFTSMFLHAGLFHLFGNMLYLYIFGDNVEDAFGHVSYFIFYIVCGFAASFSYLITLENPALYNVPVVGASGAISGVLGAYLVLYPKAKILTLIFYGLPLIIPIPAILFLGLWFFMQWIFGMYDLLIFGGVSGIAYWAHIGGFIAGMILGLLVGLPRKKAREKRFKL